MQLSMVAMVFVLLAFRIRIYETTDVKKQDRNVKNIMLRQNDYLNNITTTTTLPTTQNESHSLDISNSAIYFHSSLHDSNNLTTSELEDQTFTLKGTTPTYLDQTDAQNTIITKTESSSSFTIKNEECKRSVVVQSDCPALEGDLDVLTQDNFLSVLVHPCRYDSLTIPMMDEPLEVAIRLDISHIEVEESYRFKVLLMITFSYFDNRLDYHVLSPQRGPIVGGNILSDRIWTPHIYVPNERASSVMGFGGKDVFMSISPLGKVVFTERMSVSIYCWMDLKKFPFDEQTCSILFQTWTYNVTKLKLMWDKDNPVNVYKHLHLTEFTLIGYEVFETINQSIFSSGSYHAGNHSGLIFKFKIAREIGYYIMDYFIPSMLLVVTSWVTFWLQADNAPPRVTLGTSTMLAFITLASGQSKNLPKVSYIKASEIWFLGCTVFIFLSMAEFAFVNVIWRRKKKVELKKMKSKYILKSALTPKLARRELQKEWNSVNSLHKSHSCSSLTAVGDKANNSTRTPTYNHYLTVHSLPSINMHEVSNQSDDNLLRSNNSGESISIPVPSRSGDTTQLPPTTFASMTPQEVAIWIDKKSRFIFPSAFLIFNVFYWSFVYAL